MKLWLEKDNALVVSAWRVRLLEAVAETGSLSEAASRLGVHFRVAWGKLHQMEQRLGVKLVETKVGGAGGGGSRLTPEGMELVQRFHALDEACQQALGQRFAEIFPSEG